MAAVIFAGVRHDGSHGPRCWVCTERVNGGGDDGEEGSPYGPNGGP